MYKICSLSVLSVVGLFVGQFSFAEASVTKSAVQAASTTTATSSVTQDQVFVEKKVREYFADVPVMIEIARCESKFRQFTDAGLALRSSAGMIGVFQFYEQVHTKAALALGFNLETVEGNLGYARHVYTQSGTSPWSSCVPKASVASNADLQKRIELLKKLVGLLQQLLVLQQAQAVR